ncbi:MAG: PKD domain-containing protein [Thermoplasmata archaeon]
MSQPELEGSRRAGAAFLATILALCALGLPPGPAQGIPNNNITLRSSADLTPDFAPPGVTNLTILTFTLRDDALNEYFTEARVEYKGTSISDLAAVHIFCETDRSGGSFDASQDALLASNFTPSSNPIVLSLNFKMPFLQDQQFYLVVDIKGSATHGNKVDLRIPKNELTIDGRTCPGSSIDPSGETVIDAKPPEGWASFQPDGWTNDTSPDCSIRVQDTTSGLNVSSASYQFSTDNGTRWSEWLPAECEGPQGTTAQQTLLARGVPFGNSSETNNLIRFMVRDVVGYLNISPTYYVRVDDSPPEGWRLEAPVGWHTSDRSPTVNVSVADVLSGLNCSSAEASFSVDGGESWSPVPNLTFSGGRVSGAPLVLSLSAARVPFNRESASRNLIRFTIRDIAGNLNSSPSFVIPVDTTPPGAPVMREMSLFTRGTQNNVSWSAPEEVTSGIDRYTLICDDGPDFRNPVAVVDVRNRTFHVFEGLADGVRYFYIVSAVDCAGLQGPPSAPVHSAQDASPPVTKLQTEPPEPDGENGWFTSPVRVLLNASDACSGVAHTFYILDGGQLITGNELILESDGEHVLLFWSSDNVGNQERPEERVVKVDRTPPIAVMSVPYPIYLGETALFDGSQSVDAVSHEWEFGDGSGPVKGTVVNHTFNQPGVFRVTLTVRDRAGLTCTTRSDVRVLVRGADYPPSARIASIPTVYTDVPVTFDGSGSTDEDPQTLRYEWDFGDGSGAMGAVVSHVYKKEGTYTVRLRVTDSSGQSDTAYRSIKVFVQGTNLPPLAQITQHNMAYAGEPVIFDASNSSDEDLASASFEWDFGDGGIGRGVLVSHIYSRDGAFVVRLVVRDSMNQTSEAMLAVRVFRRGENLPPVAQFSFRPFSPKVGQEVEFDASLTIDEDPMSLNYSWDFGDGQGALGKVVYHVYHTPGAYTVRLRVRDRGGLTDVYTSELRVAGKGPSEGSEMTRLAILALLIGLLALLSAFAAVVVLRRRQRAPATTPLRGPPKGPPPVVEMGLNYLIDTEKPEPAYDALRRLVSEGARGLLISHTHPKKIPGILETRGIDVLWLSEISDEEAPNLEPSKMDYEMTERILEFIKTHRSSAVVMIDGLELLIQTHGFEKVLEFVHNINEVASLHEATVLVPVNSRALKELEYNQLKRKFDRW